MSDLTAIRKRDADSAALWFTGPASFTAQAARDRRELLREVDRLLARVPQPIDPHTVDADSLHPWDRTLPGSRP